MELTAKTRVLELIDQHPYLEAFLISLSGKFQMLKNPIMRRTVGRLATLQDASGMSGIPLTDLIERLQGRISGHDPEKEAQLSQQRQALLKGILKDLHSGTHVDEAKRRFEELARETDAAEIAALEQALIADGIKESEIKSLCDVHVQVFKGSLDKNEVPEAPEGHPVHTFMKENRIAETICETIDATLAKIAQGPMPASFAARKLELATLLGDLSQIDRHYLRKENQLFPMLEKHGVTGPSRVMWAVQDDIRKQLKQALAATGMDQAQQSVELTRIAVQAVRDMVYKEEHILFPMSLQKLSEQDWEKVRHGEEELGYAWMGAASAWGEKPKADGPETAGQLRLDTGMMSLEQIRLLFTHLPVDISFVNENDEVLFYSANAERIFPRSPGVIGRKVQNCHPANSVHVVNQILDEFRAGKKDTAEFWIQMRGKFIHIRYFAVRDEKKAYKGCLEVSQDVTGIRALEGERRLLAW